MFMFFEFFFRYAPAFGEYGMCKADNPYNISNPYGN
jgi:hypothetical protein